MFSPSSSQYQLNYQVLNDQQLYQDAYQTKKRHNLKQVKVHNLADSIGKFKKISKEIFARKKRWDEHKSESLSHMKFIRQCNHQPVRIINQQRSFFIRSSNDGCQKQSNNKKQKSDKSCVIQRLNVAVFKQQQIQMTQKEQKQQLKQFKINGIDQAQADFCIVNTNSIQQYHQNQIQNLHNQSQLFYQSYQKIFSNIQEQKQNDIKNLLFSNLFQRQNNNYSQIKINGNFMREERQKIMKQKERKRKINSSQESQI